MSTIKAINIQHPSSANTNIVMDANGNMTVAGVVSTGSPMSGMRNRLINGAFDIWQRGTSVTYLGGSPQFLADRWGVHLYQNARHQRVSVTSPPTGLTARYALRASSSTTSEAAGGTRIDVNQTIENLNCYDLAGKTITLSFWVKFSAATASSSTATPYGNFAYTLGFITSSTNAASFTTYGDSVASGSITNGSLPTTWTKYTLTATVPSGTNNIQVIFQFSGLGSTASADTVYFDVTQVQLEEGSIATPFERRLYGQELALCQRYYWRGNHWGNGYGDNTNLIGIIVNLPVTMRTQPTVLNDADSGGIAANGNLYNMTANSGVINNSWWYGHNGVIFFTTNAQITRWTTAFARISNLQLNAEL